MKINRVKGTMPAPLDLYLKRNAHLAILTLGTITVWFELGFLFFFFFFFDFFFLMWIIFNVFIESVTILLLFCSFGSLAARHVGS